jgi:PPK2 family polyphosphate:nucleotide phosphotransferase
MGKKDATPKKLSHKKQKRRIAEFVEPFRVTNGKNFRLGDYDADDTRGVKSKEEAVEYLKRGVELLAEMQDRLYAQDQWGVLLIFQAMDAAGKDGAIKHVMSGVNPQGCQVFSFKAPTSEELDHDFLWRTSKSLPERGRIGIFNRSYYEEVLVVRVHRAILELQKLPRPLLGKDVWDERYEDIRAFERYFARQGYLILKFFLNVSKKEQKRRFLERLELPEKNWKFSLADAKERGHWKDYMRAYEDAIRATATKHAPWYVVPADKKWFARVVVAGAIYDAISKLGLRYPEVGPDKRRELAAARTALLREGAAKKGPPKPVEA